MLFFAPSDALVNTLLRVQTAGLIYANFDRQQAGAAQNVDFTGAKEQERILRPGAILLPNLDIDENLGAGAARRRFTYRQVDARNQTVDGGNDHLDVTLLFVAEAAALPAALASRIDLELAAADARRIRVWKIPAANQERAGTIVLGPGAYWGATSQHRVVGHYLKSEVDWEYFYVVEALTLAGDPALPAPTIAVPGPPGNLAPVPSAAGGSQPGNANHNNAGLSIYPQRSAGDVWMSVHHYDGRNNALPAVDDRGLFTIAPWIMTWNTLDCERVYVADMNRPNPPASLQASLADDDCVLADNHCMLWDLREACHQALGLAPPGVASSTAVPANGRDDIRNPGDVPFFVIDRRTAGGDRWVQDEFEIGYCYAPHEWMHVAVHCGRERQLATFVREHMAHAGLGVFEGISSPAVESGVNYGGNLEVSPPVLNPTPAIHRSAAGPSVKAHTRAAPFGKIILGDDRRMPCDDNFRDFLFAQRVQPVLPLDTSWLAVGHVDEFMTFIRGGGAARANGDHDFKLLFASFDVLERLLQRTYAWYPNATLHAGKYFPVGNAWVYDEQLVGDVVAGADFGHSRNLQATKLDRLLARLQSGLSLQATDVIAVPTWFRNEHPGSVARGPGMVNMLVVNNHLMIPRPFGPRLSRQEARRVLTRVLGEWYAAQGLGAAPAVQLPANPALAGGDGTWFWARPGESLDDIAAYFCIPPGPGDRAGLIDDLRNGRGCPAGAIAARDSLRQRILNHGINTAAGIGAVVSAVAPDFDRWMKIWIPDRRVDLIEGYMASVLQGTGNTLHFIDDFECYHAQHGEIHCGTNAKRTPPEVALAANGFVDRWWDLNNYDASYDTTYAV